MANVRFGGGIVDIRGSIGGSVFSRGAGGSIIRGRTKPINVRSPMQVLRRSNAAIIAHTWSNALSAPQRQAWNEYAAGSNWTNKLGDVIQISGSAAYARASNLALLIGGTIWSSAPTLLGHAAPPTITPTATADDQKIGVSAAAGGYDPETVDDELILFASAPTNPGRTAPPSAYRYIGHLTGVADPGATIPAIYDSPYVLNADQVLYVRAIHMDPSGRVSPATIGSVVVTAT